MIQEKKQYLRVTPLITEMEIPVQIQEVAAMVAAQEVVVPVAVRVPEVAALVGAVQVLEVVALVPVAVRLLKEQEITIKISKRPTHLHLLLGYRTQEVGG